MVTKLSNHRGYKKDILKLIENNQEVYPLRKESNGNLLGMNEFSELKNELQKICCEYFNGICGITVTENDFIINNSWLNNFRPGLKLVEHAHRNSHISGCYYVNYDGKIHPPLQFKKSNKSVDCTISSMISSVWPDKVTDYNKSLYTYTPQEGEGCIFNSNIVHMHSENVSSKNRISLAFNCVLKHYKTGGDGGRQYEIFIKEIP